MKTAHQLRILPFTRDADWPRSAPHAHGKTRPNPTGQGPRIYLDELCPACGNRGLRVRYAPGPTERHSTAVCQACGHHWSL